MSRFGVKFDDFVAERGVCIIPLVCHTDRCPGRSSNLAHEATDAILSYLLRALNA